MKTHIAVALIAYCQVALCTPIYISKDEHGNLIYSDTPPPKGKYQSTFLPKFQTTEWAKTPKLKSTHKTGPKRKTIKRKNKFAERKQNCTQLRIQLNKIEKSLSKRNNAAAFTKLKAKLNTKRKEYRKICT